MAILHVPGDYASIEEAADAANPGDTILVAGSYEGNENAWISVNGLTISAPDTVENIILTMKNGITSLKLQGTSDIEVRGTDGDNTIVGNDGKNVLAGNGGADTIRGGHGNDWVDYRTASGPVQVTLTDRGGVGSPSGGFATGAAGADTLTSIERIRGSHYADTLTGNNEDNWLRGNKGDDTLDGGGQGATSDGDSEGSGDWADYRNAGGSVSVILTDATTPGGPTGGSSSGADGADTLISIENLRGGDFTDFLTGNSLANILIGGLGDDTLDGGANGATGDTASYRNATGSVTVTLTDLSMGHTGGSSSGADGADTLIDIENLIGSDWSDSLTGNSGANRLEGGLGNDTLDGKSGVDTMIGGLGDDTYRVDNAGDVVVELDGQGNADVVLASTSYTLGKGVYVEFLQTNSTAGTVAINLTGNELAQTIIGNAAVNNLSDGGGAGDVLKGLGGNDIYRVASAATTIVETSSQGTADVVLASTSYTLGKGVYVEFLQTNSSTGTAAINLTGNELSQTIIGNAGINSLSDGGGVGDVLKGLGGNDIYRIASAATTVVETSSQGTADVVLASVSFKLNAGAYVEFLQTNSTAGTGVIDLTGNELAQTLVGNAGANRLDGKGGADTLTGRDGKDTFVSSALNLGVDTITDFKAVDDTIELSKAVFGALSLGTLSTAAFTANTTGAATDSLDRIIYQTTTGKLFYDTDGTGTGAAAIYFATLTGQPAITNADFVVV